MIPGNDQGLYKFSPEATEKRAPNKHKNYHIVVNAGDISSYKRYLGRMKSTDWQKRARFSARLTRNWDGHAIWSNAEQVELQIINSVGEVTMKRNSAAVYQLNKSALFGRLTKAKCTGEAKYSHSWN